MKFSEGRGIHSSVSNTLKTYMPPAKRPQLCLYHEDHRDGKIFDKEEALENNEEMLKDGWVDTPAKLSPLPEAEIKEVAVSPTMNISQLVKACKNAGFHVLTDVELAQHIAAAQTVQPPSIAALADMFDKDPTSLTKEELVVLGADYDLKLKMTMKEETMIGHINKAVERFLPDPL